MATTLGDVTDHLQVSTATETREQAIELARGAVKAKLAAGAQVIGPVTSVFVHLGEFGQSEEWQLTLKTTTDRYDDLQAFLLKNHPWQNPEIGALPILRGAPGYLRWISETVGTEDAMD